jgi:thymidine kinase
MASNGKPFPEMTQMLPWATKIEKCTAVCTVCGRDAFYTHKKLLGGDEHVVQVGGSELYEPRCFEHHLQVNARSTGE